ncbi:acetyl-CoA carboxylase carboxyltransferase subunit beta [Lactobacillus sp. 0.1XD8-4]|uniref:Acetyl-coenzyme A carboxylase carboxyl transferase subunit beta n=1 Tax=Limosilactobacillus walteri TaxID=2268022 RepID=A0ABR8P906_9LACO|nr:acetyl-CoA carboxylase, carboxyltransferase subunit beta [Limosilactobacillus walteri]MBD5807252.1 acetyl-CoA carboxylase carboxyltransferase subunit beta [Limosilactobacillus walteri]MRN06939.1 acetyl-CoA carboxylase carboxyltransferase subunit beta [Lactobacillus sp. 0.1XD8-4]
MKLYEQNNTLSERHVKADKRADAKIPDRMWIKCPYCCDTLFAKQLTEYAVCPNCDYGFRITARQRVSWLTDDFVEFDSDLQTKDPLNFPGYQEKINNLQAVTNLNDAVLTGEATINTTKFALGIMDPTFIMGSLGTVAGEKITRLFEYATAQDETVVMYTASGGARMQEGILSLMQMAKISQAIANHNTAGLLYIVVLTDPTTGGVTASFAMDGDIILAEPHALIGFAGRRVIEQTIHEKLPKDTQSSENLLKHGFIDAIIKRQEEKEKLEWLIKVGGGRNDCA